MWVTLLPNSDNKYLNKPINIDQMIQEKPLWIR